MLWHLVFAVTAAVLCAAQSPNRQIQPTLSLAPPYFAELSYWNTGGTTQITEDFLRLTADRQHQRGRVTAAVPANIGDAWEVDLKFRVTGQADQFFGDGLAFWYTEKPLQEGPGPRAPSAPRAAHVSFSTLRPRWCV